jgi:hypothetical protein
MFLAGCAARPPVLVPPAGPIAAVEGFGSISLQGADSVLKGRFAFHFRVPGRGRIEALDPLGRTIFYLFLSEDRGSFVLPREKAYIEEPPAELMGRILGFPLRPDEIVRLLGGTWEAPGPDPCFDTRAGWDVWRDGQGRVARGGRDDLRFSVREFFAGAGVPRDIEFAQPGMTGRLKILSLRFNPPERAGAFDTTFVRAFSLKTWEEIEEIIKK